MEKLIDKLRAQSIIVTILFVISATWIIIDYFIMKDIKVKFELDFGLNWMLLIISGVAVLAFHVAVAFLLFLNMRIVMRNRSLIKKEEKSRKEITPESEVE